MYFDQEKQARKGAPRVLSCRATVDVPVSTARTVSRWITAHRRRHDVRPRQRAATSWAQAVMLLRQLIEAPAVTTMARDAGVSPATAYRYPREALDVVSSKAPDLPDVLRTLKDKGGGRSRSCAQAPP